MKRNRLARRPLLLLLSLLMLLGIFSTASAEESTNLLQNPGFEEIGADGLPVGWKTDAYLNLEGVTFYTVSDNAMSGAHSVQIENLDYNDARFCQTVAVEPSSFYRLSGYVKAWDTLDEGLGGNLSIKDVYVFSESVYDSPDEWQYVELYGVTDTDQHEVTVYARLGGYSGESFGTAMFDDLSLVKVDAPPEGIVASRWYQPTAAVQDDTSDDLADTAAASPAWPWMTAVGIAYVALGVYLLRFLQKKNAVPLDAKKREAMPLFAIIGLIIAAAARLIVANSVSGYQVDVNCFLAWGNTLLSVGPANFYQTTNFCDYPPAYVYIMGLNAALMRVLPLSAAAVHKLIPMACDLVAAVLTYRIARKKNASANQAGILMLLMAFNPAIFLNSAGWCQIDSVLSLLLMLVAYFAVCGNWMAVMPIYMLAVLVKPQALMLGFLGLAAIVMALIRDRKCWKPMLIGVGLAVVTAVIVVLPFSVNQGGISWLIDKYAQTLSSYPYATVNTANFYYLFGCNWTSIVMEAPRAVPLLMMVLSLVWTGWLIYRAQKSGWQPDVLTGLMTILLIIGGFGLGGFFATQSGWTRTMIFHLGGSMVLSRTALLVVGLVGLAGAIALGVMLFKRKRADWNSAEIAAGLTFALIFLGLATFNASFTMVGLVAMALPFVMVLPMFIRSGKLENLALCGGVLFVLLYVFGIKMHERYLFPALFLLWMVYAGKRDRRTLVLLLGLSATAFINEGIVLDNSLRLGSSLGHLNNDTVVLAMLLSAANVALAFLGVWTCRDVCLPVSAADETLEHPAYLPVKQLEKKPGDPRTFKQDVSLHWRKRDWLLMLGVTLVYAVVALTNLGSMKAPQNPWVSSTRNEQVIIDLGEHHDDVTMLYFCQVSYSNFSVAVSEDGESWSDDYIADMAEGECFQWKYLTPSYMGKDKYGNDKRFFYSQPIKFSARYVRITSQQIGLKMNEAIFQDANGDRIPATVIAQLNVMEESTLYSDANNIFDEQDTLEGLPSWWNSTYFDEIYHARTAYEHLHGTAPYETSHPPLGKVIMSLGIAIFGMVPFGWRVMGALAGILMLPAMYLLGKQLTKKSSFAFAAALMLALDCQHFTQTRIATIDSYPVLFILFSWLFMLRFMQRDIVRLPLKKLLPDLALSGLFMGLGIASKWIGVYSGAGLAVAFFWTIFRHMRMAATSAHLLKTDKSLSDEDRKILTLRDQTTMKRVLVICLWCLLFFVAIPLAIYLLAYIPYFAYAHFDNLKDYLTAVWNAQLSMFSYHSKPGLGMDHPFYSPWYEWIFNQRPMYYASPTYVNTPGWSYAIWCFGNPAIWSAALVGFAYTVFMWAKRHRYTLRKDGETLHWTAADWDVTMPFLLLSALSQFLPWVLVPRGTYIYHYFATTPFLMLSITVLFRDITRRFPKTGKWLLGIFLGVCLVMFVAYFPYASGTLTPTWWLDFMEQFLRIYY